jgi:hypothetical protein
MADPKNKDDQRQDRQHGGDDGSPQGPDNRPPQSFFSRQIVIAVLVVVGVIVAGLFLTSVNSGQEEVSNTEFFSFAERAAFEGDVIVEQTRMYGELKPDTMGRTKKPGKDYIWTAGRCNPAPQLQHAL